MASSHIKGFSLRFLISLWIGVSIEAEHKIRVGFFFFFPTSETRKEKKYIQKAGYFF